MNFKSQILKLKYPIVGLILLIIPRIAYAESTTTVDVKANTGQNTICINGKCETSSGTGRSKVCINGECFESDGDIEVKSENGNTSVDIKNNSQSSVKINQNSKSEIEDRVETQESVQDTSSEPVDKDKNRDLDTEGDREDFSFVKFVKDQLSNLRKIITLQFLFGGK